MVTILPYPYPIQPVVNNAHSFFVNAVAKTKSFTFPSFKCIYCTIICPRQWNWKIAAPILLTLAIGIIVAAVLISKALKAKAEAREAALLIEARLLHRDNLPQV
jgi:hypothetical protein